MIGTGSVWAQNMRAYSTGMTNVMQNATYSEGVLSWTAGNSNGMTVLSFTAGTLSKFSKLVVKPTEGTGQFRIYLAKGNTNVWGNTFYSINEKVLTLSDLTSTHDYESGFSADDLKDVTSIRVLGNGNSGTLTISPDDIYLEADHGIGTTSDWNDLSAVVEGGLTKVNVSMTDDVSAGNTMVGTSSNPYQGTFDGAGHTLTFTYSDANGEYIAPFQYAQNATFNNLLTAGSISAKNMLGGIIANACGTCTLNNCGSTMTLAASNGTNDSRVGGLVARCADTSTPAGTGITLNYCAYNGNISSSNNQTCGFIGWVRTVTATLNYCLAAPTSDVTGGGQNVASTGNNGTVNATNTYYTTKFGSSSQATAATAVQLASGSLAYDLNTGNTGTLFFGQGNLNKSNIEAYPTLTSDATKKVVKLTPQSVSTPLYANPGGAAPNPVRYGALGFRLQGSSDNPSLVVLPNDITDATILVRRYDQYTLSVSSAGATTLVLPFDAELPSGVTAYDISYTSGADNVTATSVDKITADKPVLINAAEGTYTFTVSNSSEITWSEATVSNGALTGVYVQSGKSGVYNPIAYVPANSYVLQNGAEGLGFYKVEAENTIKITSFRAYLTAQAGSSPAPRLSIVYNNNTTGINSVREQTNNDDAIYTLNGVRVSRPTKGIYIKNGKKYIVK